jgi:hypothetical protein
VTGGTVYRGSVLPASIQGHYFFTDYCDLPSKLWSFTYENGVATNLTDWTSLLNPDGDVSFVTAIVGRRIRTLPPGSDALRWNLQSESGERVRPGVYFVRDAAARTVRLTVLP